MKRLAVIVLTAGFASGALAQGAAPVIPHPIDGYLVTRQENNCLECHDKPREIGRPRQRGANVPAPASHYAGKVDGTPEVVAAFFRCTTCHTTR